MVTTPKTDLPPAQPDSPDWFKFWALQAKNTIRALANNNLSNVQRVQLPDFADDAAANAGGIPVGSLYQNAGNIRVRVT